MVNTATGGIKKMGWNKIDVPHLAVPQGNEHSVAVLGTTGTWKAYILSPRPCPNLGD